MAGPTAVLLIAAMFQQTWWFSAFLFGLPAFVFMAVAFDSADLAKQDWASDIVLDDAGFVIEGGPLDKTKCAWSAVHGYTIVDGEARSALRWLVLSWLTARQLKSINANARVPVKQLELARAGEDKLVAREAEGDEDPIARAAARCGIGAALAPPTEAPPLPQEILACPNCSAPQVPVAAATMPCAACGHEVAVPAELQQRVRAAAELDDDSGSRERVVRTLVDQPSARRAGAVIASCRKLMVWIQPVALALSIAMLVHSTGSIAAARGIDVARTAPDDDGLFFYDLGLLVLVIAGVFAIAWSVGHAYIANRQALRMLAGNFGAVPPAKPGAPSTCRHCNAPLPATTALLVHCAYCATRTCSASIRARRRCGRSVTGSI